MVIGGKKNEAPAAKKRRREVKTAEAGHNPLLHYLLLDICRLLAGVVREF